MVSSYFLLASAVASTLVLGWGTPILNDSSKYASKLPETISRVLNGVPVSNDTEYPFVVDLSAHPVAISSSRFCTGTLIHPSILLTAAHCVLNEGYPNHIYATVGRIELQDDHETNENKETFKTIASIVHPEYRGVGSPNDIAVMLLNDSSKVTPVALSKTTPKDESQAWVVGYGIKDIGTVEGIGQHVELMSGRLQKTALRIKEKSFCDIPGSRLKTQDGMLCTAGVKEESSACKGDSGGGLFTHPEVAGLGVAKNAQTGTIQVGVVSYGDAHCMSEDSGVFTDVASVKDWIDVAASKLREASSSLRLDLDGEASASVTHSVERASEDPIHFIARITAPGQDTLSHNTTFYAVHTKFKKEKLVSASLCDESSNSGSNLLMVSNVDSKSTVDSSSPSCLNGKLSSLSYRSGTGTHVIGVTSTSRMPLKLRLSSSVIE